jgi:serine/threonine protein kinase
MKEPNGLTLKELESMVHRVEQQFGSYRLLRFLGDGGFAEVYLGEHIHLGTQAAIKVLHARLSSQDEQKFRDEARTVARLVHPHIVRVLDFGVEGQTPFLVMDYAANGTLLNRHPPGAPVPLPLVITYVKQVADALHYAHNEKIIHRDVKPENLLICARNEILLADFGIAAAAHSTKSQVLQEKIGTFEYMAPEQIQGYPLPASDQYSLAIVVYSWLTGTLPFHGPPHEVVAKHLYASPPPMRLLGPRLPLQVEQAVSRALQKDPKQRFESVKAFASAFERASTPAVLTSSTPESVLSAVPSAASASYLLSSSGGSSLTRRAGTLLWKHDQLRDATVAWSPDGQYIAVGSSHLGITICETATGRALATYHDPNRQYIQVAWSPDGQWLAATTSGRTIEILIPGTGQHEFTYGGHFDQVHKIAWAANSRLIASLSTDAAAHIWDIFSGYAILTLQGASAVAWSSDGEYLAIGVHNSVRLFDAAIRPLNTINLNKPLHDLQWLPGSQLLAVGTEEMVEQQRGLSQDPRVWARPGGNIDVLDTVAGQVLWSCAGSNAVCSPEASLIAIWRAGMDEAEPSLDWFRPGERGATGAQKISVRKCYTGQLLHYYSGHRGVIASLAWSPTTARIASGSSDGTVQLWNAVDGGFVYIYRGHSNDTFSTTCVTPYITHVSYSPGGSYIASIASNYQARPLASSLHIWAAG